MMKSWILCALMSVSALAQSVRYDGNVTTTAANVPINASAAVMTVPNATVTVCGYPAIGNPCTNTVNVFFDQALTQPIDNPITTDPKGRFGFWIASGTYTYSVQDMRGQVVGSHILSLAGGGGAGNPVGLGVIQTANLAGNAFFSGGTINTDASNTANNGISRTRANLCGALCTMFVPPTSTDTEGGTNLNPSTAGVSSVLDDWRFGTHGYYVTNPQPGLYSTSPNTFQAGENFQTYFTLPNPSPEQGGLQTAHLGLNEIMNPGYSLGDSNCPPNCPGVGHTAALNWSTAIMVSDRTDFWGSGIRDYEGHEIHCLGGEGDCSRDETNFFYEGGNTAPSDEAAYAISGTHAANDPDLFTTIVSITDDFHLKIASLGAAGNNRPFLDTSNPILLHGQIARIDPAGATHPIPTVVYDAAHGTVPASYARGTVVGNCQVPIQEGTYTNTTCIMNVEAGTIDVTGTGAFDGFGLFCMAQNRAGNIDFGVKVTAVTHLSGTQYSVNLSGVNRSIVNNPPNQLGYFFQGGTCGAIVNFDNEGNVDGGKFVAGSAFYSIGSYSTTEPTAIYYNGSQTWSTPGGIGSFQSTQATAGPLMGSVALTGLTRDGAGTLTAAFIDQNGGQDFINGLINPTISGCSDASVNGVQSSPFVPVVGTVQIAQAGPATSCASAIITAQTVGSTVFWGARAYDVIDHSTAPGADPFSGNVTLSYQPHFAVGHTLEMTPTASMNLEGQFLSMDMQQPCQNLCPGYNVNFTNSSAFAGPAFYSFNASFQQNPLKISGLGGTTRPGDFLKQDGLVTSGLTLEFAPLHYGHLAGWTRFNPSFPAALQNTDVLWLNNGAYTLHFDNPNGRFSFHVLAPQTNFIPAGFDVFNIDPNFISSYLPHRLINAQFLDVGFVVATQFRDGGVRSTFGGAPAYDMQIAAPTVTVNTAGSTQRFYWIQVNTGFGITWTTPAKVFNSAATANNVISCSVMPAGTTGTVYTFNNPQFVLVGASVGQCTSPAASVTDNGTYTVFTAAPDALSMGAPFYTGSVLASPKGEIGFTQQDNFNDAGDPRTPGPTWKTGVVDPTGACKTGSLYSNSAGAATHVFWVCVASAWVNDK